MSLITLISIGLLIASLGIAMAIYFAVKRKPQTAFLDPEMLRQFNWDEFDVLIAESFRSDGFVVRDNPGGGIEGAAELIIAKNRNGPTGFVDLFFYHQWMRFEDMLDPDR